MRKAVIGIVLILMGSSGAFAQGTTSRVSGTIADRTGSVVPGATVTLTNESTGVAFTTVSNETGAYAFEAVQVGTYSVVVELQGFKRFSSTGNAVRIGEPATINAVLDPGGLAETVEVRASAQVVQTNTSGNLGSTFDQRTIESLPILGGRGRNPLDLVLTQPGVVSGANTGGGVHVNGARDRSWNFTLDGIDTNESSAGGSNFSPLRTNPDALAEFKVLTGNQTAEYGRNSGGQVAMITRSGTNSLSGTGFYFDRRPEYNANEWENNIDNIGKRQEDLDIAGFSLGGPILPSRTSSSRTCRCCAARARRARPAPCSPNRHGAGCGGTSRTGATIPPASPTHRSTPVATWCRASRSAPTTSPPATPTGLAWTRRFAAS